MSQNHQFRPPRGYAPLAFKADEMKEVIQETMDVKVKFHDGYWKISDEGTPGIIAASGNALI